MNPNWEQLLDHFEQVMASGTDEALQVDAMKKLAYLCNCVPEEIFNRTIQILAKVLDDNDSSNGLSWLASEIGQSGAIHSLLRLLSESDHDFRRILLLQEPDFIGNQIAEDVFCILAVAEENAVSIAEHLTTSIRYLLLEALVQSRFWLSGAIAKLSYDEAVRVPLNDESEEAEELRDITKEADINFSEDPSLRERISVAIDDL
ncbi:hypothetical protein Q3G72_034752 [Acer saccharum]|nr:hypothetical protein Q3G72_021221 [Acer saccharum]KAK1584638.1 hypothetical protein Q3G72_034752 [Acer saccharum]